ncbi:hypothetical protein U9M48_028627 [Paspalum notatum var. saurae]|uniref:Uncharacterized protein n=1 Tax=Paspalum notatum var. saurae TaxID=547442 RepID=A0AAQ3TX65_PASNO
MILATPSPGAAALVLRHHLRIVPRLAPSRRRKLLYRAHAAVQRDDATRETTGGAEPESSSEISTRLTTTCKELKPALRAPAILSLSKDYSHTLFYSECLEVLGLVDLDSLRKRPRLTVGVTVKASVVLPVLVVLAVLYLTDIAKGVVDWTHHLDGGEDVGD